jgi:polysaccharide chain length determinant protein (PEP-CTERM system associated)
MHEQLTLIYGYLYGMWRYRWSALFIAWVVALIGWPAVFSLPDEYKAKAFIYVDTQSVMKPLLKGLAVESDATDELQIISRVLLSRENLLSVIRETDMDLEVQDGASREKLINRLTKSIVLKGGGGRRGSNDIYEISYTDSSAERVYQVVSNLLNTLIENTLNSNRTDTIMAQKFLDTQIKEYEERLTIAEEKLADFKRKNVGYMPDEKGGYYMRLQKELQGIEVTQSAINLAQRRHQELSKQLKGESPLLDNNSYGAASGMKLRKYREQLEDLLSRYTEQHPDVQAIRAKIADLLRDEKNDASSGVITKQSDGSVEFNPIYQELKVELNKASIEIETLKTKLAEQKSHVAKLKESIDIIPAVEAQLSKLNRGYEVTHSRYLDLVERRESARMAEVVDQSGSNITFRIIDPPVIPKQPSGPPRLLYLSAVLLAAMVAGLGWSLLRYFISPTYVNLQQIRSSIDLPVLGAVSLHLTPEHRRKRHLQLITYLLTALLLFGLYGGVLLNTDKGVALVSNLLSASSIKL